MKNLLSYFSCVIYTEDGYSFRSLKNFHFLTDIFCSVPIQYILKEWDFRDVCLKMRAPVFIPRPETEVNKHNINQRKYRAIFSNMADSTNL